MSAANKIPSLPFSSQKSSDYVYSLVPVNCTKDLYFALRRAGQVVNPRPPSLNHTQDSGREREERENIPVCRIVESESKEKWTAKCVLMHRVMPRCSLYDVHPLSHDPINRFLPVTWVGINRWGQYPLSILTGWRLDSPSSGSCHETSTERVSLWLTLWFPM